MEEKKNHSNDPSDTQPITPDGKYTFKDGGGISPQGGGSDDDFDEDDNIMDFVDDKLPDFETTKYDDELGLPLRPDFDPKCPEKGWEEINTPNIKKDPFSKKYTHNCQRCVICFELWCRGYEAIAAPRGGKEDKIFNASKSGVKNYLAFLGIGWDEELSSYYGKQAFGHRVSTQTKEMAKRMAAEGEGARFVVRYSHSYGGHIVNAVVKGGVVLIYDAQDATRGVKAIDSEEYVEYLRSLGTKPTSMVYFRTDNRKIGMPEQLGMVTTSKRK